MFCFESPIWTSVFKQENIVELTTMFRQKDPLYIEILSQIRRGYLDEDKKKILQSYVGRKYDPSLNNGCFLTKLFAIRSKTDYMNNTMFSQLEGTEYVYSVVKKTDCTTYLDSSKPIETHVLRHCSLLSLKELEYETETMVNNLPCSQILRLKRGTAVMCTINLDIEREICNGSQGIVIDIVGGGGGGGGGGGAGSVALPVVRFSNGVVMTMQPHFWQSENVPTLSIGQIPLSLAWSLTIHKMQGTTLNMAEIDIGQSIFEYGQSYVALSRVQSLDGLYLSAFHAQKIKANPKVLAFYNSIVKPVPSSGELGVDFSRYNYKEKEKEKEKEPLVENAPSIKVVKL
jgi:ATP-dependent DNA helicase PIF1